MFLKCEWSKQLLLWQDVMLWVNSRWQQTLMFLFLQHFSFTQFICSEVEEIKRILYFSKSSKTTIKYSFTSKSPAFNNILKLWEIKCSESWNSWVFLSDMWRKSRRCVHQSSHNIVYWSQYESNSGQTGLMMVCVYSVSICCRLFYEGWY